MKIDVIILDEVICDLNSGTRSLLVTVGSNHKILKICKNVEISGRYCLSVVNVTLKYDILGICKNVKDFK